MHFEEERSVGPALGADSIRLGYTAAIWGLALVAIFMVVYYRLSGIIAVLALTFNIVLILSFLAWFGAVLTLPGIAGIILTIGMAVDANVLIFERIKEEWRLGRTVSSAIEGGFGKAFGTIFDANVTTLIAAIFLFQFGTGPIRGFATTITIGILASMFTAVFVARVVFDSFLLYKRKQISNLSI
jgi:preprotein translocase subunit SecD